MNQADMAIISAFGLANVTTSRFFERNPDAYEEALDQILIHNVNDYLGPFAGHVFSDGSRVTYMVRYAGRRAIAHVGNIKREVGDVLLLVKTNCGGKTRSKAVLLQSKRLYQVRTATKNKPLSNPLDEIETFISAELTRAPSTFDCGKGYGELKVGSAQWKLIEQINKLSRNKNGNDLVYYMLQNPETWPPNNSTCAVQHPQDLGFRVVSQTNVPGSNKLCPDMQPNFTTKAGPRLETWIAEVLACKHGYVSARERLDGNKLELVLSIERRQELATRLEDSDANADIDVDAAFEGPIYVDATRCSAITIDLTYREEPNEHQE